MSYSDGHQIKIMNRQQHKGIRASPLFRGLVIDLGDLGRTDYRQAVPKGSDVDKELRKNLSSFDYERVGQWWASNKNKGADFLRNTIREIETDLALQAAVNAAGSGGNANA